MPTRRPELLIRIPRIISRLRDIFRNNIETLSLLVDHMRNVSKQLIQLPHTLLDVADLGLALGDEGFVKVDLALVGKDGLLLLELLLLLGLALGA